MFASILLCAFAIALVCCAPAGAARGHAFASSFGEACNVTPCGAGQLNEPSGVAVNEASGEIYVLDQGDERVERFSATGVYEAQFDGSGKYEVVGAPEPQREGPVAGSGGLPGERETGKLSFSGEAQTSGVAVDNSCALQKLSEPACKTADPSNGDVYVLDAGHEVVDKFSPDGEYLGQITEAGAGEAFNIPLGVAVDTQGTVWVYQQASGSSTPGGVADGFNDATPNVFAGKRVVLEKPAGTVFVAPGFSVDSDGDFYTRGVEEGGQEITGVRKFDGEGHVSIEHLDNEAASAVAVDQLSNSSFVDNLASVAEFSPTGSELERLAVPGKHGSGLAINASPESETLYVADSEADVIDVYPPLSPGAPTIESEAASDVSGDSATLEAEINTRGGATRYHFEYGACSSPSTCASSPYGQSSPIPDALAGSDFEVHAVSVHVQGLSAHTSYHFRIVAQNEAGGEAHTVTGQERTFDTQSPGGELTLPDARQWELVSPADKLGALIAPIEETGVVQAAASGDAISYIANAPIEAQPQGVSGGVQVLSTRGSAGWGSRDLTIPHGEATGSPIGPGKEFRFFSEDLAAAFVQPFGAFTPSISPEASEQTALLHSDYLNGDPGKPCLPQAGNCNRPLVSGAAGAANVPAGTVFGKLSVETGTTCPKPSIVCGPEFEDATPDGSHAIVRSIVPLTETPIAGESLYEWSGGEPPAQQLQLVSVLPGVGGQPAKGPALGYLNQNTRNAISADGSRVVWEAPRSAPSLYMRNVPRAETIELDSAQAGCGECESGGGRFQLASSDGSKVLFTDKHRLTSDAGQAGKADLYQCEMAEAAGGKLECELSDLTPRVGGESADVQGSVIGAGEEGSWVYFVANGVLTSAADSNGEAAAAGRCRNNASGANLSPPGATCNLYAIHGGQTKLVGVLSGADIHDWAEVLREMPARVAANGQWLAFMSQRELSGYDNRDASSGQADAEVYLYSAASGAVACASCEPSGARPGGVEYHKLEPGSGGLVGGPRGAWESKALVAANVPGWTGDAEQGTNSRHQPRYLADDGRLYFDSADGLVSQDVNGTQDVYQYEPSGVPEPAGVPGCDEKSATYVRQSGGCVSLISSGASSRESAFLDASESGADVFFLTAARLQPALDNDASLDVYDAHQCSAASPCPSPAADEPPPCDTGDSCKPAPSPQPEIFGAPGSALFSGAGNLSSLAPAAPARKPPPPTRAQRLRKALAACHKRFPRAKKRRGACEQSARRQFAPKRASKKVSGQKPAASKGVKSGARR
jgi:DNA-binding beta-propeller fold protein YncE